MPHPHHQPHHASSTPVSRNTLLDHSGILPALCWWWLWLPHWWRQPCCGNKLADMTGLLGWHQDTAEFLWQSWRISWVIHKRSRLFDDAQYSILWLAGQMVEFLPFHKLYTRKISWILLNWKTIQMCVNFNLFHHHSCHTLIEKYSMNIQ